MQKLHLFVFTLFTIPKLIAQVTPNNPIFQGGSQDGTEKSIFVQSANNIFAGGANDGIGTMNFSQPVSNIFAGNVGDGQSSIIYLQATYNIFAGGNADGWNSGRFLQSVSSIFAGGEADGWSKTNYLQAGNSIFAGGISDGWSNVYYKPIVALPVKLAYFNAKKIHEISSELRWKTTQEVNSAYFEIERGTNALSFISLGKVIAQGNSKEAFEYNFVDKNPLKGINYYRLKQVDLNGKYEYSPARAIVFENMAIGNVKYYPNPSQGILNIELDPDQQDSPKIINIFNSQGVVVEHFQLEKNSPTKIAIDLNKLPKGAYFVNLNTNTLKNTQKIMLN